MNLFFAKLVLTTAMFIALAAGSTAEAKNYLGFPPHHKLWLCISHFEGGVHSVNPNGHYGMLQMSWNWLGYIKGAASNYPQPVQEWAAEHAYKDNRYAHSFLYGQWFNYEPAIAAGKCLRYA